VSRYFDYPAEGGETRADQLVVLRDLSPADWDRLLAQMERRRFTAGAVIIATGEVDRALYLIASGSVEIILGSGRRQRRVREQGPGTILGEVAFFDGQPRSATVRALGDCEVLRLNHDAFEVLAAKHPDLGRRLLLELGRIVVLRLRGAEADGA
jgi:CRP/FNR family cyclic AMP-dependent transcriptional regulator